MTTAPLAYDFLGASVPALPMLIGLISLILTRVMLIATEPRTSKGWWYYNVSLTLLLAVIAFVIILDRKFGPGMSLIVGVGVGASGVLIVDIMKARVQKIIEALR